ncbi:TRAP transporter small permease [Microbacterium sp. A84]|uniref:TRAP transporter small permease n=1 Tax=Microbacterium sp. A84 TaxID=3450715 RepID=UPI003F431332
MITALRRFDSLTGRWSRGVAELSAIGGGILALLISAEVVSRSATGTSIRGLVEIAELVLVVVVFLGMAQAERIETHVRVTLLTDKMPDRARRIVRATALLIAAIFIIWMATAMAGKALNSFESGEFRIGLLHIPLWPSRAIAAIGTILLAVVLTLKGLLLMVGSKSTSEEEVILL